VVEPAGDRLMRALVTGAHGFVGTHLVRHLTEAGDEVTGLDRHSARAVDITDADATREAVADAAPEVVYHLAGWANVGTSWAHPVEVFQANAVGTLHVLLACRDAGVRRVLVVGSADLYGKVEPDELPLTETSPLRPTSPYAASKAAAEDLALQAHLGFELETVCARPFNHLGPGQSEGFVAPGLAARIARAERDGQRSIPVGNLSARRDFTDVRDVVRAYRLMIERAAPGEVYNVCSGVDVSIDDLATRLLGLAGGDLELETDPELLRPVDLPVLRGDATKLTEATGWTPEIPLEQTLSDLLADMRRRVGEGAT
jgi:GDP-4-dehydro-6-deoxy-D-mannose reductase